MNRIIVIVGPTGVGKTEIAVSLAEKFQGEIINADSRQFYGELVVGTSRPTPAHFQKISHHLFGVTDLLHPWDAAHFRKEADQAIATVTEKGKLPFIVGGTGLYVRSLLFGIFKGAATNLVLRKKLENRLKEEGLPSLYVELCKVDPTASLKIHPNDPSRILRALEVYHTTGIPISKHQKTHNFKDVKYKYLKLGINRDRETLYDRLNRRVDEMVSLGLEEEVLSLRKKYGENPLLLRTIGYQEWFQKKKEEVIPQIKQNTRNFAKRQLTWFRKETDIVWFEVEDILGMGKAITDFLDS